MVIAFQAYGKLSSVNVRPMTAISDLSNIHEDICTSAHQKRVAMIILPFHKHQRIDGSLESLGHAFHQVNELVLSHAPCSVGILVDRGLGGTSQVQASDLSFKIVVPFFGGGDDREALSYGLRMAEHPGILLIVVKFVASPGKTLAFGAKLVGVASNKDHKVVIEQDDKEQDDELWSRFLSTCTNHDESIKCEERLVESKGDIETTLKEISNSNLMLIGRMPAVPPLVTKSDCPDLGPIGSYLASSQFSTTASVVVIQQYNPSTDIHPLVMEESDYREEPEPDTPRV